MCLLPVGLDEPRIRARLPNHGGTNIIESHPSQNPVQSHDILYTLSRDILYTPARGTGVARAMAWKTMDVHEQRVRFVVEATQKVRPFSALCAAYEISRPTGYLWLKRYRKLGVEGIAEQSRKPHHSPRRRPLRAAKGELPQEPKTGGPYPRNTNSE